MERIKLSRREKQAFRILSKQGFDALSEFDHPALGSLERMGLVQTARIEGVGIEAARLTTMGKEYLRDNPRLFNPINWAMVSAIVAAVGSIGTIITIIITCSK